MAMSVSNNLGGLARLNKTQTLNSSEKSLQGENVSNSETKSLETAQTSRLSAQQRLSSGRRVLTSQGQAPAVSSTGTGEESLSISAGGQLMSRSVKSETNMARQVRAVESMGRLAGVARINTEAVARDPNSHGGSSVLMAELMGINRGRGSGNPGPVAGTEISGPSKESLLNPAFYEQSTKVADLLSKPLLGDKMPFIPGTFPPIGNNGPGGIDFGGTGVPGTGDGNVDPPKAPGEDERGGDDTPPPENDTDPTPNPEDDIMKTDSKKEKKKVYIKKRTSEDSKKRETAPKHGGGVRG